ncbi:alpha-glucan family phosphorylase [Planctomyces sp. SH-PL14]|uniref:alpha-glucan family phosphorylase n=1 Tax=Planctomyces sp. SH-PL14 TaxID=1632864 RepID=UPI00078C9053|nr:alpha-glucan family phosphorylase [Planctomyces sp. SH-PL14]AMV19401.1 Glycogen phosphorylase [Planctomyces sp. SH-PL14]
MPIKKLSTQKTIHEKLSELARNLWWSWQPEVVSVFREIDPVSWSMLQHNPILLLKEYGPDELEIRAREEVLHARIHEAYRRWREYMTSDDTWASTHTGVLGHRPAAYFSAEFGLHESLRIYSGGLGLLAGDHLKSASDLGVPLVAVGLFYYEGYFSQTISPEGWQQEAYNLAQPQDLPISETLAPDGSKLLISVPTRSGPIFARVWTVNVGRIPLYLLDSNVPENKEEDRRLTARLYGGDQRTRIRQEMLLGIGGVKALDALGIHPRVFHMNEGHSAFASLELIRMRVRNDGLDFSAALREVAAMGVFTTHTPVEAGHDRFDGGLIGEHLGPTADELGLNHDGIMGMGRVDPHNHGEPFCMTVLAFKTSRRANAVSNLHGVVSRRMWRNLWPWRSEEEIPIGHITNGVHVNTWLAPQMRVLYDRVLPLNWHVKSGTPEVWAGIESLSAGEIWETHEALKNRLINHARLRLVRQAERHKATAKEIAKLQQILDPQHLLIGFARRFAPYKRADLILRDLEQLAQIIADAEQPVQFVFAGKAHPADNHGKEILKRIHNLAHDARFAGRVVFLEDYDINLARHLVQGVDVWLNNPRRPLEASGTSGQKVVLNGGLNLSVLDGWWAEAFDGRNGFGIGNGLIHVNSEIQDERDAESLMTVLQKDVIPMYYRRDQDGLPLEWIARMKRAVRTLGWRFNADRMVMDYVQQTYVPAAGSTSSAMMVMP